MNIYGAPRVRIGERWEEPMDDDVTKATTDPTTTTLTRWAILKDGEQFRNIVKMPRCTSLESAERHVREKDAAFPQGAPHRVVRVDVTITDPVPAEEGQG